MRVGVSIALVLALFCGGAGAVGAQDQVWREVGASHGCDWLAPFVDDASMGVVVVDIARLDADAVAELLKRAGANVGTAEEGESAAAAMRAWKESFARAGAAELAFVLSLKDPGGAPAYFVVKPRAGADLEALRANIDAPAAEGGQHDFGTTRAAVIEHGCVVVASEIQRKGLGAPERAAAMNRAFDLAGDAPVRVALFPADYARRAVLELMPRLPEALGGGDTRVVAEGLEACGGALELGANPSMHTAFSCSSEANAVALAAWLTQRAASVPAEYAGVMKPARDGSLVRMEAAGEPLRAALVKVSASVIEARRAAEQMQVMMKARNAIMGCWMYSQSHNETFPSTLEQLVTDKHITQDVIKNSEGAEIFVYIRPGADALKDAPAETVMVHQKFVEWPTHGLAVGFVDGHIEVVRERKDFEKLLARKPAKPAVDHGGISK